MAQRRFTFKTLDALQSHIDELGLDLPVQHDPAQAQTTLRRPVAIGGILAPNAFAIQPMEGCDGTSDGRPDELTIRRYQRFARGGAGLIWFEATAVQEHARANPRQLWLNESNLGSFASLRENTLAQASDALGAEHRPFCTLQLTHSGRYARSGCSPTPVIAHHDGVLDGVMGLPADYPLISDAELDKLQDDLVAAAHLAARAGFDGVGVKSCHRYLLNELLAAHTRDGKYGGSFENRTRMLLSVVRRVREELPDLKLTVRLNMCDGHPWPWGWGVSEQDPLTPDLTEPRRLVALLAEAGVELINVTAGNPYYTPAINRPYDRPQGDDRFPNEDPLVGVTRLMGLARCAKEAAPNIAILATGFTWLRHHLVRVAAGMIEAGWCDLAGLGRMAFAYPDAPRDLVSTGRLDPRRCCVTCSRCSMIMGYHGRTGCVVFDRDVYGPIFQAGRAAQAE